MNKIAFHCECGERLVVSSDHVGTIVCSQCECENEVPGLSRRAQQKPAARQQHLVTPRPKTDRIRKSTTRQKTFSGRMPQRRSLASSSSALAVAAVGGVALVLVFLAILLSSGGGSDEGGESGTSSATDQQIKDYVNGLVGKREAYLKTWESQAEAELGPAGASREAKENRKRLVDEITQMARRKFKKVSRATVATRVKNVLNGWDKKFRVAEVGTQAREREDPDPVQPAATGPLPSAQEVRLFLDSLPRKKDFLAACHKAVNFESKDTRQWWEREREQAKNFMLNEVRLRYKNADRKKLNGKVGKILEEWRKQAEKTSPPEKKAAGPSASDPPKRPIAAELQQFLAQQADLRTEFLSLYKKYGGQLGPGLGPDARAFHLKLIGRLRPKFPGRSDEELVQAGLPVMRQWVEAAKQK